MNSLFRAGRVERPLREAAEKARAAARASAALEGGGHSTSPSIYRRRSVPTGCVVATGWAAIRVTLVFACSSLSSFEQAMASESVSVGQ
jgi:hypothetical protein